MIKVTLFKNEPENAKQLVGYQSPLPEEKTQVYEKRVRSNSRKRAKSVSGDSRNERLDATQGRQS